MNCVCSTRGNRASSRQIDVQGFVVDYRSGLAITPALKAHRLVTDGTNVYIPVGRWLHWRLFGSDIDERYLVRPISVARLPELVEWLKEQASSAQETLDEYASGGSGMAEEDAKYARRNMREIKTLLRKLGSKP